MSVKNDLITLRAALAETQAKLEKSIKDTDRLREICYRKLAQAAREKVNDGTTLYERFRDLKTADFLETAISIFSWEDLPESELNVFNSKRIETQVANFGKVVIFPSEYVYNNASGERKKVGDFLVLPFNGALGALDSYGEYPIIKPYAPSGSLAYDFPTLTVNKDCVVISDFFNFGQTNNNLSLTLRAAIDLYCSLIADCETAKKINRNWLSVPLLFSYNDDMDEKGVKKDFDAFIKEVKEIVENIEGYSNAIVTSLAKNIMPIPTGAQDHSAALEQAKRDYENELLNYLGIGTIRNENKVRKITAEFEETSDIYNINIVKRLQNRERANEQAKKIWGEKWGNPKLKVNLQAVNALSSDDYENERGGGNVSDNDNV